MKVKVGQTVYLKEINGRNEYKTQEAIVTKVGRLYFYTGEGWQQEKFEIDTGKQRGPYIAHYEAYESLQSIKDADELSSKYSALRGYFDNWFSRSGLTLEKARAIYEILDLKE